MKQINLVLNWHFMFRLWFLKRECELIFYLIIWGCVFKRQTLPTRIQNTMSGGQIKPNIITVFDKKKIIIIINIYFRFGLKRLARRNIFLNKGIPITKPPYLTPSLDRIDVDRLKADVNKVVSVFDKEAKIWWDDFFCQLGMKVTQKVTHPNLTSNLS